MVIIAMVSFCVASKIPSSLKKLVILLAFPYTTFKFSHLLVKVEVEGKSPPQDNAESSVENV